MRTCSAWALPLGVAHQGISLTGGHTLLCEFQTLWDPSSQKLCKAEVSRYGCLCIYVLVRVCMEGCVMCVCLGMSLLSLPLAWGPPGESLEL